MRLYFWLITVIIVGGTSFANAAFEDVMMGSRPVALGSAFVGLADDGNALFLNPAGLSQLSGQHLGTTYFRQFNMTELDYLRFYLLTGTRWGVVGLGYTGHGDALYGETALQLSYSRWLMGSLALGVSARWLKLDIANYGNDQTLGLDIGLLFRPHARFQMGLQARHLNAPTIGVAKEELPQSLTIGAAFSAIANVRLVTDIHKEIENPARFSAGIEYHPIQMLALRIGVHNEPDQFATGFGVHGPGKWQFLHLDYALQTHQTLGVVHHFSFALSKQ